MTHKLKALWIASLVLMAAIPLSVRGDPAPSAQLVAGIRAVLVPASERRDGVLTVSDNNLYVQCLNTHVLPGWRCEAAGLEGQPWLEHVLTSDRQKQLIALGFKPDPQFGNFTAILPRTTAPDILAARILEVLAVYGAKPEDVKTKADWLKSRHCQRRIKVNHDRGGSILTPQWGFPQDAEEGCGLASGADALNYDDPTAIMPQADGIDLEARYIPAMTAELTRIAADPEAYAIFEAGPAYVQCMPDDEDRSMYCEAASGDAVGNPVERILTPERKAKLIAAGFEPPGKVMNYRRLYPRAQFDMKTLANALLDVLRDAYGYQGAPPMKVSIEDGSKRLLVP